MISSSSNQQIKNLIQLQTKAKVRNKEKLYVIEGLKMFDEVASNYVTEIEKTYISESCYHTIQEDNKELFVKIQHTSFEVVSDKVFKDISETITPQGIMAIVKQPEYHLDDILKQSEINLVLLEDLRDPGNLGTIIRTAEGAGISAVVMSKTSVDIFNPKVIRSTMGAIYRVPFIYVDNMIETIELLVQSGIDVYATHLNTDKFYDEVQYGSKNAILIGNEANGLSDEAANAATTRIKIPMEGEVESLNAGVATAIMMYELYRQRRMNTVKKE